MSHFIEIGKTDRKRTVFQLELDITDHPDNRHEFVRLLRKAWEEAPVGCGFLSHLADIIERG